MLQAITDNDYDKLTAAVSAAKEPHRRHIWEPEWRWRDVVHKGAGRNEVDVDEHACLLLIVESSRISKMVNLRQLENESI